MDSKCQNGSISGAAMKGKLTWQTDPNQELTSVLFRGVGKSMIDWMNSDVGCINIINNKSREFDGGFCELEFFQIKYDNFAGKFCQKHADRVKVGRDVHIKQKCVIIL